MDAKFRYVFKRPNGFIVRYYADIQHLEHGDIMTFLDRNFLSIERDLISRDLYTGFRDKNKVEIYERDRIKYNNKDKYQRDCTEHEGIVVFKDGMFKLSPTPLRWNDLWLSIFHEAIEVVKED